MVLDAKLLEMRIAIQMCDYVPKTVYQFENQSIQDSGKNIALGSVLKACNFAEHFFERFLSFLH